MKLKFLFKPLIIIASVCFGNLGFSQTLEDVIVEEYSTSIVSGQTTYRVYLDMGEGDKLLNVFGFNDDNPTTGNSLEFSTTTSFYQDAFGSNYGEGINSALFGPFPTAQADTWICFGGAATNQLGIPLSLDDDGSAIGGNSPDGFVSGTPSATNSLGLNPAGTANTIGTEDGSYFVLGGVEGVADDNIILIGQFTTDGDFSFEINIQLQSADGVNQVYTHTNAIQPDGSEAIVFPGLKFPVASLLGCTESTACNFDVNATEDDGSCILPEENCTECNESNDGLILIDSDSDGTCDAEDSCPDDPNKTAPGACGCGVEDVDTDSDGTLDCFDGCPSDPDKTEPGECGCGVVDEDLNENGIIDCNETQGCTDQTASNYNPDATLDDGTCSFEQVEACDGQIGGLEGVILEEYYVDAPTSGFKTYRLFIDLAPGYKLLAVYGFNDDTDNNGNSLEFSTSTGFYNDQFGQTFGEGVNTALFTPFPNSAIDTWLSFGGAAAGQLGIPKANDNDGSNLVPTFTNVPSDGISPSESDGYIPGMPASTNTLGMTATGAAQDGENFIGTEDGSFFVLGGVQGSGTENTVLIGQFTTDGDFSYKLNVQVQSNSGENEIYVHTNSQQPDGSNGRVCSDLMFPQIIDVPGCTNELSCNYNPDATTDDGSCTEEPVENCSECQGDELVTIDTDGDGICDAEEVVGCTNELSCNYNASATDDDGSCTDIPSANCSECSGDDLVIIDTDGDGVCNAEDECPLLADLTNGEPCETEAGEAGTVADCNCVSNVVQGCTSPTACNFDDEANQDDGSCIEPVENCSECNAEGGLNIIDTDGDGVCDADEIAGCTNEMACNYNPAATDPDPQSCIEPVPNCLECDGNGGTIFIDMDGDGICDAEEIAGCTSETACNYNPSATNDDDSCIEPVENCIQCGPNGGIILIDSDGDGVCNAEEVEGCTDETACNYDENATEEDGSCIEPVPNCVECDGSGGTILVDSDDDGICDAEEIAGCTNEMACNYNASATDEDGSCVIPEDNCSVCNSEGGLDIVDSDDDGICDEDDECPFIGGLSNGDPCETEDGQEGTVSNCECVVDAVPGCTSETACNYNANATQDDGSCIEPVENCTECDGAGGLAIIDTDGDGICDADEVAGCTDETAENYDPNATDDDGSCTFESATACDGEQGGFEGLIVEEYYTDGPSQGFKTYRVYADLAPGYKLLAVYGYDDDVEGTGNDLSFNTTTGFYNNEFGVSFGENLNTALFESFQNSSLDSYLTFGGAASNQLGIPKADDTDESALVPFLTNVPGDGISPSEVDGYTEGTPSATNTLGMMVNGVSTDGESFAGTMDGSFFVLGGVQGTGSNNTVLLGQFTTDGDFGYRINLQVQSPSGENELYVHTNAMQPDGSMGRVCSELRFPEPAVPGCTDETACNYDEDATEDDGSCYFNGDACELTEGGEGVYENCECTPVVIVPGCTDELACNFNEEATEDDGSCYFDGDVCQLEDGSNGVYEDCECVPDIPSECNYVYYLADILEDGTTNIYEVELSGTTAELTSLIATSEYEVHIAFNEVDGLIYAVSKLDGSFRTLDPETGDFGPVEMLDTEVFEIVGATFNGDGKLMILSQSENAIYSVNLGPNEVSVFDSYSPVLGGDIDFGADGTLYLGTREGFGTFYIAIPDEIASDILVGSAPQLVTGVADTQDENLIFSHRDATTLMVREYDGTEGTPYDIVLGGEPFMTFNGDLASGCSDNQQQEECDQVIYYTNQPDGGSYMLYSTVLNGDGTSTNTELLSGLSNAHIGVTPDGSTIYIVGGSDLQIYSVAQGMIVNTVDIVSAAGADLSNFPACVVTEDGTLYVGGNGNNVWEVDPGTGIATLFANISINGGDLIEAPTGEDGAGELWVITRNNGQFTRISDGTSFSVPVPEINGAAVLENGNVLVSNGDGDGSEGLIEINLSDLSIAATYDTEFNVFNGDLAATCASPSEIDNSEEAQLVTSTEPSNVLSSYPNPTNGISQAVFVTGKTERTTLEVYDIKGRLVKSLFNQVAEAGIEYRVDFDGLALPNGVYVYRLTSTSETIIEKFIIAK